LEEIFGFFAHFILGLEVECVDYVGWNVGLIIDMAASAKVFAIIFAIIETFHFVFMYLNTTVSATEILSCHLI
jgi:hypothetical protein